MKLPAIAFALAALLAASAGAVPVAYVPNERSGSISVIDTAKDEVVATIRTGGKPRGTVVSADGRHLYASDQPSGSLLVVDLDKREVVDRIPVGASPEGVGMSRDGAWIAVAVEENNSVVLVPAADPKSAV